MAERIAYFALCGTKWRPGKLWGMAAYEEGWNRKVKDSCCESSREDKYWRHMWQNLAARVVMSPLTDGTTDVNEDKCPELECGACWSFFFFFFCPRVPVTGFVVTFPHYFTFIETVSSRMTVSDAHIRLLTQLVLEVPSYIKSYWPKRKEKNLSLTKHM